MRWPGAYSVSTLSSRGSIIDALDSGYSNRCIAPNVMSLGPKLPMRCSGDQVSLNIEGHNRLDRCDPHFLVPLTLCLLIVQGGI